jgi:acrylyl-CoA reductase (NADPH)
MPLLSASFDALRSHWLEGRVLSRVERLGLEDLSSGDVVLRTRHAGVNYKDCLAIGGGAKVITDFPRIAGIEAVGNVVESAAPAFRSGDAVMVHGLQTGIAFDGGFSQYMRVPAEHLQKVPEGLSPLEAAVIGVPGFTAAMALERFQELGPSTKQPPRRRRPLLRHLRDCGRQIRRGRSDRAALLRSAVEGARPGERGIAGSA